MLSRPCTNRKALKNAKDKFNNIFTNASSNNYFVKQRRTLDKWNRMMLTKPDRNYYKNKGWMYYDYFVFDFLNKVFAVSLLDDEDFPDYPKDTVDSLGV